MYGDPEGFELPNSHLDVRMANIRWQDEDRRDDGTASFPEIAISPDTFTDALAGKDAALAYTLHPPNSLGDGYQTLHDKPHAIAAYGRSLELNPSNTHAQHEIDQLQHAP